MTVKVDTNEHSLLLILMRFGAQLVLCKEDEGGRKVLAGWLGFLGSGIRKFCVAEITRNAGTGCA